MRKFPSNFIYTAFHFPLTNVIDDVVHYDHNLQFEGQRFKSAIFQNFINNYLANGDRYGTSYYFQ